MKRTILALLPMTLLVAASPAATVSCSPWGAIGKMPPHKLESSCLVTSNPHAGNPDRHANSSSITCGADSDIVIFCAETGYGSLPTLALEDFLWDTLNVICDTSRKTPMLFSLASDSPVENQVEVVAVPELKSTALTVLVLLFLLRRRRC